MDQTLKMKEVPKIFSLCHQPPLTRDILSLRNLGFLLGKGNRKWNKTKKTKQDKKMNMYLYNIQRFFRCIPSFFSFG